MIHYLLAIGLLLGGQQSADLDKTEVQAIPVQGNVHLVASAGGSITVQVGNEGTLLVDTSYEQLAPRISAAIRKLSEKPVSWIVNTEIDADHVGGNDALPKLVNGATRSVRIIAHENVVNRMAAAPRGAEP